MRSLYLRRIDRYYYNPPRTRSRGRALKSLGWLITAIVFLYLALANYYRFLTVPMVNNQGAVIFWTFGMLIAFIRAIKLR